MLNNAIMVNTAMVGFFLITFVGFLGLLFGLQKHNLTTLAAAILCCGISVASLGSGVVLI